MIDKPIMFRAIFGSVTLREEAGVAKCHNSCGSTTQPVSSNKAGVEDCRKSLGIKARLTNLLWRISGTEVADIGPLNGQAVINELQNLKIAFLICRAHQLRVVCVSEFNFVTRDGRGARPRPGACEAVG
jgi:hypothetical protein